jgi:hypothetical protein
VIASVDARRASTLAVSVTAAARVASLVRRLLFLRISRTRKKLRRVTLVAISSALRFNIGYSSMW